MAAKHELELEIERELRSVEASISQVSALVEKAQSDHDEGKLASYERDLASLQAAKDHLAKELAKEREAEAYFARMREEERGAVVGALHTLRSRLEHFIRAHGKRD